MVPPDKMGPSLQPIKVCVDFNFAKFKSILFKNGFLFNPKSTVDGSSADTPLRWANRRTQETIAASSEGLASGSSPRRYLTSPLGQGMDLSSPLNYGTPGSVGSIQTPRSGIQGTPMRDRPDIQADRRPRQVNVGEPVRT